MPIQHLSENPFTPSLDNVTVARNHPIKVPSGHRSCAFGKPLAVPRARDIPDEPFLPRCRPGRVLEAGEDLGQDPRGGQKPRLGVLLGRGKIEEQIGLDHGLVGLVAEHELFVRVTPDIFVVEIPVEVRVDGHRALVLLGEHPREGRPTRRFRLRLPLLRQAVDPDELGGWVGFGPGGEEHVVLNVQSGEVGDIAP